MIEPRQLDGLNKKSGSVANAYKRGEWCYISGVWSTTNFTTLAPKVGQFEAGMLRLTRCTGGGQNAAGQVFPIDKMTFKHEDSDTDYDTIAQYDQCFYYDGRGVRVATDCYNATNITGGTPYGTLLYPNATGWLDTTATYAVSAPAMLVGEETVGTTKFFNGTALYTSNMIVVELL